MTVAGPAVSEKRPLNADERAEAEESIASRPEANHEDGSDAASPPARAAAEEDGGDTGPKDPPPYASDPRLAIADRISKRRKEQRETEEPEAVTPTSRVKADAPQEEEHGADAEAQPSSEPAPAAAPKAIDDPMVDLVVNGQKLTLPMSEVIATARKNLAADDYLAQAREVLATAKRTATADPVPTQDEDGEAPTGSDRARPTQVDRAKLVSAVEAIQTGSPEEGAEILADLLSTAPSRDEIVGVVAATVEQREAQAEATRALNQLATEYPDLAKDRRLSVLVISEIVDGMVKALEEAGAPAEHIEQIRGRPDWVRDYYAEARRVPAFSQKLRSPIDVARAAAKQIHDEFVAPRKQPQPEPGRAGRIEVSPERAARKADLPRQPRSASMRAAPGGQPQVSVADKRRAAIQERMQRSG